MYKKLSTLTIESLNDNNLLINTSIQNINLIGKSFRNLTVIELITKNQVKSPIWLCKCLCGNLIEKDSYYLLYKRTKTNTCWKCQFVGEMSGHFWCRLTKNAKKRNIIFNITKEYIWDLYLKQNKKCALSGIEISFPERSNRDICNISLDRIDSKLGYIEGNVQWVDKNINLMKHSLDELEFINLCKLISKGPKSNE